MAVSIEVCCQGTEQGVRAPAVAQGSEVCGGAVHFSCRNDAEVRTEVVEGSGIERSGGKASIVERPCRMHTAFVRCIALANPGFHLSKSCCIARILNTFRL